jgi:hypothetical protein
MTFINDSEMKKTRPRGRVCRYQVYVSCRFPACGTA